MSATVHTQRTYGHHHEAVAAIPDKRMVPTDLMLDVRTHIAEAAATNAVVILIGRVGVGKTSAVASGLRACVDDADHPTEAVVLEFTTEAKGKGLLEELYLRVLGVQPRPSMKAARLAADLRRGLAEQHRILAVDDAQFVAPRALLTMALLCNKPETNFALVLVGTPTLRRRLAPEIVSRALIDYHAGGLADDEVVGVLHSYHPLFETADPARLVEWNKTHARGEFRWWAKLLGRAWRLRDVIGNTLDPELFEAATQDAPLGVPGERQR